MQRCVYTASMSVRTISIALLIFNSLAWSSLGIYIRILGNYFPNLQQVYLRVIVAGVLVAIFGARQIGWRTLWSRLGPADWGLIVVRTSFLYLLGVGLVTVAFIGGEYSTVSLLKALPFTAIFGFLVFQERITGPKILFMTLAFCGAFLLLVPDLQQSISVGSLTFGLNELLALLSAACIAFSHSARKWQKAQINNWEASLLMFVTCVPILFVGSLFLGEGLPSLENLAAGPALFAIGMSGLLNAIGLVVINYAMGNIDIVLANNIFALQPVFGVLVGVFYYREVTTIWDIIGGVIIVGSLLGMNQASKSSEAARNNIRKAEARR